MKKNQKHFDVPFSNNKGAKVLSARLAKAFKLLITPLTTCLCFAREHYASLGEIRQRTSNRTADVQGNYPNFKRKLAEKKIFSFQKSKKTNGCLANADAELQGSIN